MGVWYDEESRRKDMDRDFRASKGLPTEEDEAIRIAAEREVKRRIENIAEEDFSAKVRKAADKMEGPSAKEAKREKAWIPMPDALMPETVEG